MAVIVTLTLNPSLDRSIRVPGWEKGSVNRVQEVREDPGGKGINVSRALRVLGHSSTMKGFLGGYVGREMERRLKAEGLHCEFQQCQGTTRANIKIESHGEVTEFNLAGPRIEPDEWTQLLGALRNAAPSIDILVVSGSVPLGLEHNTYAKLICALRTLNRDLYICLDTSGEALSLAVADLPNMIKPNIYELAALFGHTGFDATAEANSSFKQARRWLLELHQRGITHSLCSLGSEGLLLAEGDSVYHVTVPAITPVQTVGCGDSTVAGWIAALVEGKTSQEAACWAAAAGTTAALQAQVGLASISRLQAIHEQVKINRI